MLSKVASSENYQTGTQSPTEQINYSVPTSGTYCLAVNKYIATSNHKFKIFSSHNLSAYVSSSSLLSPADATGAMAVAAIDRANWTTGPQKDYSSQGPTTDGRIKPDISGPTDVSTLTYPSGFPGTSAAAPHVAGAAALILSNYPYSVQQLWDKLTSSALDMGVYGKDNIYGYGRLNLSGVVQPALPLIGVLEYPINGQSASGITAIYGWALDGKKVTKVELFIDGSYAADIPYGGTRGDVKDLYPNYPNAENSGFAMVMNWFLLSSGAHNIKVRLYNQDGQTQDLDASVTVKKFHGEWVSDMSPSGPWQVLNVAVTVDGITRNYDINMEWVTDLQGFQITDVIQK